jgi:hypothetical protein
MRGWQVLDLREEYMAIALSMNVVVSKHMVLSVKSRLSALLMEWRAGIASLSASTVTMIPHRAALHRGQDVKMV